MAKAIKIKKKVFDGIISNLIEGEKYLLSTNGIIGTFDKIGEPRLLIKALECLQKSIGNFINCILKIEFVYGKAKLSKDTGKNIEIFFEKYSGKYGLGKKDIEKIRKLIFLGRKHKEVGFEFSKNGKMFMMDDDLKLIEIDRKSIVEFIFSIRGLEKTIKEALNGLKSSIRA